MHFRVFCPAALLAFAAVQVAAQQSGAPPPVSGSTPSPVDRPAAAAVEIPPGYVIGPEDQLSVVFWRDKDLSVDVVVRPDGKISLPLLNDVIAAGYTPEQLRVQLVEAASKFVEDPNATVVVREIRSRKVFITGIVGKPGTYPLITDMNVLQFIALAGGLQEYADAKNILIVRNEGGKPRYYRFNYKDVVKQKNVQQNIMLKPGDTVIVP